MGQTMSKRQFRKASGRIRQSIKEHNEIRLNEMDSFLYINDEHFRNRINNELAHLNISLHLCLNNCKRFDTIILPHDHDHIIIKDNKRIDTSILMHVHTLSITNNNKISDVGDLRKLKKITIDNNPKMIHLLKNIEEVVINMKTEKLNKDLASEIRKLKKINCNVIIRVEYSDILGAYRHGKIMQLNSNESLLYATDKEIRDNIDKMVKRLDTTLYLNLDGCKEQIDTNNLRNVHTLSLIKNKKIKNVGDLSKLKKLTFNKEIEGLYLLKEVEEIIIRVINGTKPSKKINDEIKKLKKINPNVKVEIVEYADVQLYGMNYNIMRIMSGMGGLCFSN